MSPHRIAFNTLSLLIAGLESPEATPNAKECITYVLEGDPTGARKINLGYRCKVELVRCHQNINARHKLWTASQEEQNRILKANGYNRNDEEYKRAVANTEFEYRVMNNNHYVKHALSIVLSELEGEAYARGFHDALVHQQ